ncbi:hypothetical protein JTE90_015335 [Oedothorax gibbosus]|uniref:Major facilitator superfamily associated domain-containing protein n=1 Tax=Oedothorax gibbosus TaxID=931172 RepID=A0AAV6U4D8_9ARAC|nr:hypothetical protein JTE90_015335 [Oedothorax gibbosus]
MRISKEFWKIDRHLLPIKAHYFLFFAALAAVLPFRTVFAKQLGISATAAGVIFLAIPFTKTITNPLFGVIVDYFKKIRLTLSLTMIFVAVSHVAMLYVPPLYKANQLRESDLQVQVKYHYFEDTLFNNNNVSYLEIYSQLESMQREYSDISCEITCKSESNTDKFSVCSSNITLKSKLILKRIQCHYEHSFADGNVFMYENSSKKLVKIGRKVFDFNEPVKRKNENNCSISHLSHRSSENAAGRMTSGNSSISQTLKNLKSSDSLLKRAAFSEVSDNSQTLNTHELFLIDNEDSDFGSSSSCLKWLPCVVSNFSYSETNDVDIAPYNEYLTSTFWMLFMLFATSSASFAAVTFLIDAVCYEIIDNNDKYGTQRLWGTIGWGLGAFVGGYLNQLISTEDSTTDYTLSFYLLALLTVIGLIPVSRLKVENLKYSAHICKDVCFIFSNIDVLINVVIVFFIGVVSGLMWNYQFWFMQDLGASQLLLGLSQIMECWFAELPCFIISGWVIRKIGHPNCNSLTLFCFALRYFIFAYMQDPWMTLPVALIYGPTFGIFYASMTMYGKTEAPPGTEATVQSILAVAFEGAGCGTGSILGGIGFDTFGSRKTFLYTGIACSILLVVNVLLHIFVLKKKKKPSEKEALPPVDVISYF